VHQDKTVGRGLDPTVTLSSREPISAEPSGSGESEFRYADGVSDIPQLKKQAIEAGLTCPDGSVLVARK
jgi:hypothetical protein